jgi:hypothetical protein
MTTAGITITTIGIMITDRLWTNALEQTTFEVLAQLLFKKAFHAAILSGRKTTTLRRWRSCRLNPGDHVKTPGVGTLVLDSVNSIEWDSLTDADAAADGFASLAELNRIIRRIYPDIANDGKSWFKLHFHLESPRPSKPPKATQTIVRKQLVAAVRAELDKAVHASGS